MEDAVMEMHMINEVQEKQQLVEDYRAEVRKGKRVRETELSWEECKEQLKSQLAKLRL